MDLPWQCWELRRASVGYSLVGEFFALVMTWARWLHWLPVAMRIHLTLSWCDIYNWGNLGLNLPGRFVPLLPGWNLLSRCRFLAAKGHPDSDLWLCLFPLTWPLPVQPGVGHLTVFSCIANTEHISSQVLALVWGAVSRAPLNFKKRKRKLDGNFAQLFLFV